MVESEILYGNGPFWVTAALFGSGLLRPKSRGYIVWQDGATHAVKVASFSYAKGDGLRRAVAECDRRAAVLAEAP